MLRLKETCKETYEALPQGAPADCAHGMSDARGLGDAPGLRLVGLFCSFIGLFCSFIGRLLGLGDEHGLSDAREGSGAREGEGEGEGCQAPIRRVLALGTH